MQPQRVVIIGAVALGPKVACRLKRLRPDCRGPIQRLADLVGAWLHLIERADPEELKGSPVACRHPRIVDLFAGADGGPEDLVGEDFIPKAVVQGQLRRIPEKMRVYEPLLDLEAQGIDILERKFRSRLEKFATQGLFFGKPHHLPLEGRGGQSLGETEEMTEKRASRLARGPGYSISSHQSVLSLGNTLFKNEVSESAFNQVICPSAFYTSPRASRVDCYLNLPCRWAPCGSFRLSLKGTCRPQPGEAPLFRVLVRNTLTDHKPGRGKG